MHSTFCTQGQLGLKIIIYWGPLCSQPCHNLDVWHMLLTFILAKVMQPLWFFFVYLFSFKFFSRVDKTFMCDMYIALFSIFKYIFKFFIPLFLYHMWKILINVSLQPFEWTFGHSMFCMQGQLGLIVIKYWGPLCSQPYHNLEVWHMLLTFVLAKVMQPLWFLFLFSFHSFFGGWGNFHVWHMHCVVLNI